jgi:GNAT superfamily N-acetyltransferase
VRRALDAQPTAVGLVLRPARAGEQDTLLSIQRDACVAAFAHIFPPERYPFPDQDVHDLWREALSSDRIETWVGDVDGRPAGVVAVADEFLRNLYVVTARQGTGVGSALHDLALERLRVRGVTRAKLWCLEENWDARRFYERRGWTLTEETRVVPFPPNPIDVQYAKQISL